MSKWVSQISELNTEQQYDKWFWIKRNWKKVWQCPKNCTERSHCFLVCTCLRGYARPSLIGTKTKERKWCICNAVLLTLSHAFTMFHTTVFLNYALLLSLFCLSFSALVMQINSKMSFFHMNSLLYFLVLHYKLVAYTVPHLISFQRGYQTCALH